MKRFFYLYNNPCSKKFPNIYRPEAYCPEYITEPEIINLNEPKIDENQDIRNQNITIVENNNKSEENILNVNPNNFNVEYYAKNSSSGGDRILDIVYIVKNGIISSCTGSYLYPLSTMQRESGKTGDNVEQCDLNKLLRKEYNVPLELITTYNNQKITDTVQDGPSLYKYRIYSE